MQRESIQASLALLLGPETEYRMRVRATRRLAKQGAAILPLVLTTLSNYPEIITPAWPWWPPQYEHTSHLLLHFSQRDGINLSDLLRHPAIDATAGPVLWISIIEAANLSPHMDNEDLHCQGFRTTWTSVHYAAAMALATRARNNPLHLSTIDILLQQQEIQEILPIQLTISYALLNSGEVMGFEGLSACLYDGIPQEIRKAATFIFATEHPLKIPLQQQEKLITQLLHLLSDSDAEIVQQAAHTLSIIARPDTLTRLYAKLENVEENVQITILTVLEEIARHNKTLQHHIRQHIFIMRLLPLLQSSQPDLRRQVCYTLAACGGEYVAAVLGTIVMNNEHPGQGEAIECLRFFYGVLRAPLRGNIMRWLLSILATNQEDLQVTALDSLAQILWQARNSGRQQIWLEISQEIFEAGTPLQLLQAPSPLLRQRTLELLAALGNFLTTAHDLHTLYCKLLLEDNDSGVRACAAYVCGQTEARWAISALLQSLFDTDTNVAQTALNALARLTTSKDSIVVYALTELTRLQDEDNNTPHDLAHTARIILKKWQQRERNSAGKTLHSSH
jgi:HEAT repeat protein